MKSTRLSHCGAWSPVDIVILCHPNPVILRLDRGIHLPLLFNHSCLTKLFDLLNGSPGQARGWRGGVSEEGAVGFLHATDSICAIVYIGQRWVSNKMQHEPRYLLCTLLFQEKNLIGCWLGFLGWKNDARFLRIADKDQAPLHSTPLRYLRLIKVSQQGHFLLRLTRHCGLRSAIHLHG